jgi:hypothetical protein
VTPGGRAGAAALASTVAALALAAGGCGEAGDPGDDRGAEAEGVGTVRAGSTAQFASCGDWRRGSEAERYATIEDIRGQLTPQSSETAASDLNDEAAYELFQHTCASDFAESLRLYKLYARAQVFAPLTSEE